MAAALAAGVWARLPFGAMAGPAENSSEGFVLFVTFEVAL